MNRRKKIQRRIRRSIKFYHVMFLSAIVLSGIAAYFSVYGLSFLFSSAKTPVIIMASTLEVAKLISVSAFYRYRAILKYKFKIYLLSSIIFLMLITSFGIYGYLSNAFQSSSDILDSNSKTESLKVKQISNIDLNIENINKQLNDLSQRLQVLNESRKEQENRLNSGNLVKFTTKDINNSNEEIKQISIERNRLNDILYKHIDEKNKIELEILKLNKQNNLVDIGPLKYLSKLFGVDINKIVNILILVLIFTFDPLAVVLLIIVNIASDKKSKRKAKPGVKLGRPPKKKRIRKLLKG